MDKKKEKHVRDWIRKWKGYAKDIAKELNVKVVHMQAPNGKYYPFYIEERDGPV